ncbi:hypothetical protein [Arhodomonas sp. SL1]|uniref:hypothetical protein n=1 Tax=Arhodomonas sp. SL1 TaxID=3425691 RepID=UPI003F884433
MWPITEFLAQRLGKPRQRELIRTRGDRLEVRNRSKAFRRIHRLLEDGDCPPDLARRLLGLFPEDPEALNEAIERTRAQRRDQERAEREALERALPAASVRAHGARPADPDHPLCP